MQFALAVAVAVLAVVAVQVALLGVGHWQHLLV
jgi:hypothetical protein